MNLRASYLDAAWQLMVAYGGAVTMVDTKYGGKMWGDYYSSHLNHDLEATKRALALLRSGWTMDPEHTTDPASHTEARFGDTENGETRIHFLAGTLALRDRLVVEEFPWAVQCPEEFTFANVLEVLLMRQESWQKAVSRLAGRVERAEQAEGWTPTQYFEYGCRL